MDAGTQLIWARIENMVTIAVCGASMVGLYALGAGGHSFWALLLLLNVNSGNIKIRGTRHVDDL